MKAAVRVERYARINDLAAWCLVTIPYRHREIIKSLGAEWSPRTRTWFLWDDRLPELKRRVSAAGLTVEVQDPLK